VVGYADDDYDDEEDFQQPYQSSFLGSQKKKPTNKFKAYPNAEAGFEGIEELGNEEFPLQIPMSAPQSTRGRHQGAYPQALPARKVELASPFTNFVNRITKAVGTTPGGGTLASPAGQQGQTQDSQPSSQPSSQPGTPGMTIVNPPQNGQQPQPSQGKTGGPQKREGSTSLLGLPPPKRFRKEESGDKQPERSSASPQPKSPESRHTLQPKSPELDDIDDSDWVHFGEITSDIVGNQYCPGKVVNKEKVLLGMCPPGISFCLEFMATHPLSAFVLSSS